LGADDAGNDALGVSVVLVAVGGVDLVIHVVRLDEVDVFLDVAGADVGFVSRLCAAEPRGGASVDGAAVPILLSSSVVQLLISTSATDALL